MYAPRQVRFERPPVVEVALALHTRPIPNLTTAHFGLFWNKYLRAQFPIVQEQPAVPPAILEDDGQFALPQFMIGPMVSSRHWYLSPDLTRLIQLQQDRIVVNWRKLETDIYPHYDQLRAQLKAVAEMWAEFLDESGFPREPVVQTEVTYVNHMDFTDPSGQVLPVSHVISAIDLRWPIASGQPGGLQLEQRFDLIDSDRRLGQMTVQVAPLQVSPTLAVNAVNIVFRGTGGSSLEESLEKLDLGHNQIVNTFRDITSPVMHKQWRDESE